MLVRVNLSLYAKAYNPIIVSNSYSSGTGRLVFNEDITSIKEYAFCNCKTLKTITLPDSVLDIGENAFRGCEALEHFSFPPKITVAEYSVCAMCRNLTNIELNNIKEIKAYAFYGCALKSLTIPSSVSEIEGGAFCNCEQIQITIPHSVRKIGKWAFVDTTGILKINTEVISEECGYHSKFSTIIFGDNVRVIKYKAFCENSTLKEIRLGCNVENIEAFAFMKTAISQLILPNSLRTIKGYAFADCLNLRFVSCQGSIPPDITEETFSKGKMGIDDIMPDLLNIEVRVPKGYRPEYSNSTWCLFKLQEQ